MKKNIKHSLIFVLLIVFSLSADPQEPQFSQFYAAKTKLAPSFAGTTEGGRVALIFRDQWPQVKNSFITAGFAIDHNLPSYKSGIGLLVLNDYTGIGGLATTNVAVQYSYSLKMDKLWQFRPGLQFCYKNRRLDLNSVILGDQLSLDETTPHTSEDLNAGSINIFDAATSILVYSDVVWFGINVDNIKMLNSSFTGEEYSTPLKIVSFGGARLKTFQGNLLKDLDYIYFSYLFKYQNKYKQLDLGVYWERDLFELGLWYRGLPFFKTIYGNYYNSAIIAKIGINFQYTSLGYSYDYTLAKISPIARGAHEISIICLFNQAMRTRNKKMGMVPSPRF
jgi:type IX secretion system PorP/SprF family membrane protein